MCDTFKAAGKACFMMANKEGYASRVFPCQEMANQSLTAQQQADRASAPGHDPPTKAILQTWVDTYKEKAGTEGGELPDDVP